MALLELLGPGILSGLNLADAVLALGELEDQHLVVLLKLVELAVVLHGRGAELDGLGVGQNKCSLHAGEFIYLYPSCGYILIDGGIH